MEDNVVDINRNMKPLNFQLKKTKNLTREQELADRVYQTFHKQIKFPQIMSLISNYGYEWVQRCLLETDYSIAKNPPALFMFKIREAKVVFVDK